MSPKVFPTLARYLSRYDRRRRTLSLLRSLGLSLSLTLLFSLTACLADRFLQLSPLTRQILLAISIALLLIPLIRPLTRLFRSSPPLLTASRIERRTSAFNQRLLTLVSDHPASTSPDFLTTLQTTLLPELHQTPPRKLLPLSTALRPWLLALFSSLLILVLSKSLYLNLPSLSLRLLNPTADLPPITTTHLTLTPGPTRLIEGSPLTLSINITPIPTTPVLLRATFPNQPPSLTELPPTSSPGHYEFTFPSIDQDLTYSISAGDATSPDYPVTALRHPAISTLSVRYTYPDYIRRAPFTLPLADGLIEAPVRSIATLILTSTQPLLAATLTSPNHKIPLTPTPDPHTFQANLSLTSDEAFQLDLTSDQQVSSRVPTRILLRPFPDRPPVVRLVQPIDDLRLDPHAVMPVQYQSLDDFGVATLSAHIQINSSPPRDLAIPLPQNADPRQLDATYDLDLAPLDLKVGDLLAISLIASDGLHQSASTESRHVLITPRSIDIATYQRISDLKLSAQTSASLTASLEAAGKIPPDSPNALAKADPLLAGAAESEMLLRQSLLRALSRSDSPQLSTTLCNLADALTVCTSSTAKAAATLSLESRLDPSNLSTALSQSRLIQSQLATLSAGQQAAATLADRNNLRVAAHLPTTQSTAARVQRTLDRARADVTAAAAALGLDTSAPDLDAKLEALVAASQSLIQSQSPPDFAAIPLSANYPDRLDAAANAESVRPDADVHRVADLHLAAAAARSIEDSPLHSANLSQFPRALAALFAEHSLTRHPVSTSQPTHNAALSARAFLRRLSGQPDLPLTPLPPQLLDASDDSQSPPQPPATIVQQVQESLTAMPGQLSDLLRAATTHDTPALTRLSQNLDPQIATSLSHRLSQAGPDIPTTSLDRDLTPALRSLQLALSSNDPTARDSAATLTRNAIATAQESLRQTQSTLANRDPLRAAKLLSTPTTAPSLFSTSPLTLLDPNLTPPPPRGPTPPGYEDALQSYFHSLNPTQ